MELTIGILSFNSPKTLYNTLLSYKKSGLFEFTDDIICVIQPSNLQNEEFEICKQFNINNIILNNVNTLMAGAIDTIHSNAKYENILFLENDFRVCIKKEKLYDLLRHGLNILKNNEVDIVRLRSLKNPGHQIQYNLYKNTFSSNNIINPTELYLVTHFLEEPHLNLPDYISKIYNSPLTYLMISKNCVYTNNPHIVKKSFYNQYIKPYVKYGYNLESQIDPIWYSFQHKIAITEGCFTHMRMDGHNGCDCCPIECGGISNNCIWLCCNQTIKSPKVFEESDLI
jgi:hypothetical protein